MDRVAGLLAGHGHDPNSVLLAGFSQGACLVADHLLRRPRPWAGAVIWTGAASGPPGTVWPSPAGRPPLTGLPAIVTNSDADPWVPLAATEHLAASLREHGAAVDLRVQPGGAHEVADDEIHATAALLARLGATRTPRRR